jgi:hypothetical protein
MAASVQSAFAEAPKKWFFKKELSRMEKGSVRF